MNYLSKHKYLRCFTTFAIGFLLIIAMAFPYVKYSSVVISVQESGFSCLDFTSPIITQLKYDWINSFLGIFALFQLVIGLCTMLFSLISLYSLTSKSSIKLCNLLFSLSVVFLIVYAVTGFIFCEAFKNNKFVSVVKYSVSSLSYVPLLLSFALIFLYAVAHYMTPKPKTKVRYFIEEDNDDEEEENEYVIG